MDLMRREVAVSRVCHLCGTSIPDGAEYCPACGASCSDKASGPEARNSRGLVAVIVSCIAIIACAAVVGCLRFFKVGPFASVEKVVVQLEDIPDEAFRTYLAANVDTNETGAISEEEVAAAVAFGTAGEPDEKGNGLCGLGISDLTGIEHFTSLKSVVCSGNNITELDLSKNTQLTEVICNDCELEELVVPSTDELRTVYVTGNPELGEVDLSGCPSLDDVLLDESTQVVGVAPAEDFDAVPVEDLALVYCTAADALSADSPLGAVGPSAPGEDADFDYQLVFLMVYNRQFGERPSLGFGTNTYGLDYSEEDAGCINVPEETVRQIIASFYGSCPDDLSYLNSNVFEPVDGGWRLLTADGPLERTIESGDWQVYGDYVTFTATVTYKDGFADDVVDTFEVTALRDEGSVFGYSLCAQPVRTSTEVLEGTGFVPEPEPEPEPAPEEIDYYAYAVERLDAAGKIPDGYIVDVDSETADTIMLHVYEIVDNHTATAGWYELNKNTLVITDVIFGGTI